MAPVTSYRTIARDVSVDIEVKRSVFRCQLRRITDEAQARAVVDSARAEYWDARHHCSAFIWLPDGSLARSSDDGEPSGTAGAPMLEVLRGAGLTEVVAVVSRWFGGTLLGAGGLVRAYSDSVRTAVRTAGLLQRHLVTEQEVHLGHDIAARVESSLRSHGVVVLDASHGSDVALRLGVRPDETDHVAALLAEVTQGSSTMTEVGERWVDVG